MIRPTPWTSQNKAICRVWRQASKKQCPFISLRRAAFFADCSGKLERQVNGAKAAAKNMLLDDDGVWRAMGAIPERSGPNHSVAGSSTGVIMLVRTLGYKFIPGRGPRPPERPDEQRLEFKASYSDWVEELSAESDGKQRQRGNGNGYGTETHGYLLLVVQTGSEIVDVVIGVPQHQIDVNLQPVDLST
jgi:hypothetical protein